MFDALNHCATATAIELHRGIRIERIGVGILQLPVVTVDIIAAHSSAFIPLPQWIQARRVVVNFAGTCDDFQMGHTSWNAPCRCASSKWVTVIFFFVFSRPSGLWFLYTEKQHVYQLIRGGRGVDSPISRDIC